MTKSEWASWAQAFGVVATVIVAVGIHLRESILLKRRQHEEYFRDRFAFRDFRTEVINFIGPIYAKLDKRQPPVMDPTEYARLLQRLGYFERRLQDRSATRGINIVKTALREAFSLSQGYKEPEEASKRLLELMNKVHRMSFKPEEPDYIPE